MMQSARLVLPTEAIEVIAHEQGIHVTEIHDAEGNVDLCQLVSEKLQQSRHGLPKDLLKPIGHTNWPPIHLRTLIRPDCLTRDPWEEASQVPTHGPASCEHGSVCEASA